MNGWRGGATRFLSGRAVQRQSATSMTNDGSKRGVRMTGPQRVMIWLSGERGGCLRFCGFRPRFVEGPSYLPLTDPALLLFSSSLFSLFFLFSFFYIYTHAAIGNFTPWFDQFNFHHYHRRQFEGAVVIPDSSTSSVFARCSHLFPLALVSSTWSSKRRARLAVIIDRGEWRC